MQPTPRRVRAGLAALLPSPCHAANHTHARPASPCTLAGERTPLIINITATMQQAQPGSPAAKGAAASPLTPPPAKAPLPSSGAASSGRGAWVLPAAYGLTNLSSVITIVFANKIVLGSCGFSFPVALTWLHTLFTASGMVAMAAAGLFPVKAVPLHKSLPMACVYVGFIVFNNLSIRYNPGSPATPLLAPHDASWGRAGGRGARALGGRAQGGSAHCLSTAAAPATWPTTALRLQP